MGDLEEKLLKDWDKKPLTWWRFTDDIFIFIVMAAWWKRTWKVFRISELLPSQKKVYDQLFMGGDKFSRCFSQEKNDQLATDLYIKLTDTHQYLHACSFHVYYVKQSIPYSQALGLK